MEAASRGGDANEARLHDQQAYISSLQVSSIGLHSLFGCDLPATAPCTSIIMRVDSHSSLVTESLLCLKRRGSKDIRAC